MEKTVLFILTLLFFISACREEDIKVTTDPPLPPPSDTLLINDTFLTYWYFPKGSWCVYKRKDTTANIYDTATVTDNLEKIVYNRFFPFAWKRYGLNIEHTHFHSSFDGSKANQYINNSSGFVDRISSTSNTNFFSYTYYLSWPIDSLSVLEKSTEGGSGSVLYDTVNVQLNFGTVDNVMHIHYGTRTEGDTILIAKDIGIVRFKHFDDKKEWELIDYNINK